MREICILAKRFKINENIFVIVKDRELDKISTFWGVLESYV